MLTALRMCLTRIGLSPIRSWFAALILLLVLSVNGFPAFSQTAVAQPASASQSDVAELLDILLANGTITQEQYDTLKHHYAAKRAMPAASAQPASATPAAAAAPEQSAKPSENPAKVVTATDGAVGLHIGPVDLTFSGEINGFYVYDHADKNAAGCVLCHEILAKLIERFGEWEIPCDVFVFQCNGGCRQYLRHGRDWLTIEAKRLRKIFVCSGHQIRKNLRLPDSRGFKL